MGIVVVLNLWLLKQTSCHSVQKRALCPVHVRQEEPTVRCGAKPQAQAWVGATCHSGG